MNKPFIIDAHLDLSMNALEWNGLVVATQIGRYVGPDNPLPGWHSPEQAWAQTQGQLAWYKAMEEEGQMVMIRDKRALEAHLALWKDG